MNVLNTVVTVMLMMTNILVNTLTTDMANRICTVQYRLQAEQENDVDLMPSGPGLLASYEPACSR